MTVAVRSFAKINLGLYIGGARSDGFHDLRTVYQTIALHDVIRVSVGRGSGIAIVCTDSRVPLDSSNTCYRMAERVMDELGAKGRVNVEIEKRLPVQGGLGAASSNAVATLVALERALKRKLSAPVRLRIAADVGSGLPLFLVGGTMLGVGRGDTRRDLADHVLSKFEADEQSALEEFITRAADAAEMFAADGIEKVMNTYNPGATDPD